VPVTEIDVDQQVHTGQSPVTTDSGEHERLAHIVVPASAVTEAMITGRPCTALCGKTWVPSRDPKRYPVCPTCKELVESVGGRVPES